MEMPASVFVRSHLIGDEWAVQTPLTARESGGAGKLVGHTASTSSMRERKEDENAEC